MSHEIEIHDSPTNPQRIPVSAGSSQRIDAEKELVEDLDPRAVLVDLLCTINLLESLMARVERTLHQIFSTYNLSPEDPRPPPDPPQPPDSPQL